MGPEGSAEEWPSEYSHPLIDPKDNTTSFMCKEFVNISFHDLRRILRLAFELKTPEEHSSSDFARISPVPRVTPLMGLDPTFYPLFERTTGTTRSLLSSIALFGLGGNFSVLGTYRGTSPLKSGLPEGSQTRYPKSLVSFDKSKLASTTRKQKQTNKTGTVPSVACSF